MSAQTAQRAPGELPAALFPLHAWTCTSAQVRSLEAAAIVHQAITSFELMQRAGQAAWRFIQHHLPQARSFAIACGPGNNGGDGYVLARLLKEAGRDARVLALDGRLPGSGDAVQAADLWRQAGGTVELLGQTIPPVDVVVDALFGIGLGRDLDGSAADAVRALNASKACRVALDIPSGLCADTGRIRGCAVLAHYTLSFIVAKTGLHVGEGPEVCGHTEVATLGLTAEGLQSESPDLRILRPSDLHRLLPQRRRQAHKGDFGRVLVIGGDVGMGGAVRLAAEAALRAGAGRVSVATRQEHVAAILAGCPELMVRGVAGPAELKPLLEQADVVLVGPGLGQGAWSESLLLTAAQANLRSVFDADALNLLAQGACLLPEHLVITPHPGEAARLLDCSTASVQADRLAALRTLEQAFQVCVVLKGAGTLIGQGRGSPALCLYGNPGMATAGMGDVLAGIIAGLMAQGLDPAAAAEAGVLAHALAGDRAAAHGMRGLLASDLYPQLRRWLNPWPVPSHG